MKVEGAFQRYERLLQQLHELDKFGLLDSPEADEIREQMGEPWMLLSKIAGTSSWLVQRQGMAPVVWTAME